MKLSITLLALSISASAAVAPTASAQSADVSIAGKIFPGACVVQLGGGGIADLGDIRVETLDQDKITLLEPAAFPLNIDCQSAVRFALLGRDNTETSTAIGSYGLGLTPADEKIGFANIGLSDVSVDGELSYRTRSADNGATWSSSLGGVSADIQMQSMLGFAKVQGVITGPAPITALRGTLTVSPRIAPAAGLTLTEEVQINGSATINLVYL